MKNILLAFMLLLGLFAFTGCGGDTDDSTNLTVDTTEATPVQLPAPDPVTNDPDVNDIVTDLFTGVKDIYGLDGEDLGVIVTMVDNPDINLFNFLFVATHESGFAENVDPNAYRDNGKITVSTDIELTESGKYTISLFYYGDVDVKLTQHIIEY